MLRKERCHIKSGIGKKCKNNFEYFHYKSVMILLNSQTQKLARQWGFCKQQKEVHTLIRVKM